MTQELVKVTALRAHRSGWAPGKVEKAGEYFVPAWAVPSLVRQGLVADPAEKAAAKGKASGKDKVSAVAADSDDAGASE